MKGGEFINGNFEECQQNRNGASHENGSKVGLFCLFG